MAEVEHIKEELVSTLNKYALIDAAISAECDSFLIKPNAEDDSKENDLRYSDYKKRAVYYSVTNRTLAGLAGQVFDKDAVIELPSFLDALSNDIDGCGVSLEQQSRKALLIVLAKGRGGLLSDYTGKGETRTQADVTKLGDRPSINFYPPQSIINWRVSSFGGVKKLSLIVIKEHYVKSDDGFKEELAEQYLVLRLKEDLAYSEVWRKSSGWTIFASQEIKDHQGNNLRELPFTFIGSENNDSSVDDAPIYDLASLNIAHYRNSADYEESCFMVGQPTPVVSGLTKDWVKEVLGGKVMLGSRAAVALPVGGSAELLQAQPNSMPFEAMQHKERQMVALGAKLVQPRKVQRTAEEASQEERTSISTLGMVANNVSRAYEKALSFAARFVGPETEIKFQLNTDFEINKMSPQARQQLLAEWQSGGITWSEYRDAMKKAGIASLDDEDAKELIESEILPESGDEVS